MMSPFLQDLAALASKLPSEKFNGKNILITGASGLIGSAVVKMLLLSKINVHIYASSRNADNLRTIYSDYSSDSRLHLITLDVTKPIDLNIKIEFIIDCASQGNPGAFKNAPVDIIKANVFGVSNLVEYGLSNGLERMVYVSSGEVYGEGNGRDFDEDYSGYVNPCEPRACYPTSKRAAESLCVSYSSQFGTYICIARPCHIYGPNFSQNDDRAFAQFFRNVIFDKDIVLKSHGSQIRSWLYVADCAYALLFLLVEGESSKAYNIAPISETASIRQFASLTANTCNKKVCLDIPENNNEPPLITRGVLDSTRLHSLGWNEMFSLSDGIQHSIHSLM